MIKNYIDVTHSYLKFKKNYDIFKYANYYIDDNGKKYHLIDKQVVFNVSRNEILVAKRLLKILGGTLYINPKVNYPKKVKTADYLWNDEYWDLKEINGTSIRNIDNKIKKSYRQANNFIIDNSNKCISNSQAIKQIKKIYGDNMRNWVNQIILIDSFKIIKYFKRK